MEARADRVLDELKRVVTQAQDMLESGTAAPVASAPGSSTRGTGLSP